jgi:hypothetical protein
MKEEIKPNEICLTCKGTKVVRRDEDDGEIHIQNGVGYEPCPDCYISFDDND